MKNRQLSIAKASNFQSTTGGGLSAYVFFFQAEDGIRDFLKTKNVREVDELEAKAAELQAQGSTVIFVAIDGRGAGILAVSDPIKESALNVIEHLHRLGIKIIMVTGDNERTARAVAEKLGIDQVEAGVEPQHKHERVRQLR